MWVEEEEEEYEYGYGEESDGGGAVRRLLQLSYYGCAGLAGWLLWSIPGFGTSGLGQLALEAFYRPACI